jgi:hypothetical protein
VDTLKTALLWLALWVGCIAAWLYGTNGVNVGWWLW